MTLINQSLGLSLFHPKQDLCDLFTCRGETHGLCISSVLHHVRTGVVTGVRILGSQCMQGLLTVANGFSCSCECMRPGVDVVSYLLTCRDTFSRDGSYGRFRIEPFWCIIMRERPYLMTEAWGQLYIYLRATSFFSRTNMHLVYNAVFSTLHEQDAEPNLYIPKMSLV